MVKFGLPLKKKFSFAPSAAPLLKNAHEPLVIRTYDGSNQVVHPSIIDFLAEHGMAEWLGSRYWMVITPYPNSNDALENPCLFASDDGLNWLQPLNITNPLDQASGGLSEGFNSDPDMVYDPDLDEIRVYYRFASSTELKLKMISLSRRGIKGPTTVLSQSPWDHTDNTYRSLCIWRESVHKWHMWGGGGTKRPPYNVYYRSSDDGVRWEAPQLCKNDDGLDPFQALGYTNWHMSCKPNHRRQRVEFLSCAYPLSAIGRGVLLYAECGMSAPTLIRTPIDRPVMLPSKSGWDNETLYRCTFSVPNGESDNHRVWYSARSDKGAWNLGFTEGDIGGARSA